MTPRALLTIIGATAIAFAVAIVSAAGFTPLGSSAGPSTASTSAAVQSVRRVVYATPGTHLARELGVIASRRLEASASNRAVAF
jgi:hypothetical protein